MSNIEQELPIASTSRRVSSFVIDDINNRLSQGETPRDATVGRAFYSK